MNEKSTFTANYFDTKYNIQRDRKNNRKSTTINKPAEFFHINYYLYNCRYIYRSFFERPFISLYGQQH